MRFLLFLIVFTSTLPSLAQNRNILDVYIEEALKNNNVLQQKNIEYEQAIYALKSANSLFYPSLNFSAGYTHGEGGRSIKIPVGDLMNPVYQTLNQLTNSNMFPQIQNVQESFFPNRFYDAKIRASMPLFNMDLIYNSRIQESKTRIKEYDVKLYSKELTAEVKRAYYNYCSASSAVAIYASSLELANEAKRVNESLLKNGTGLYVYVLRAETELDELQAKMTEAEKNLTTAKMFFNFLLNRSLDAEIIIVEDTVINNPETSTSSAESEREEVKMLTEGIEINKSVLKMNSYYWLPKINGFFDYGAQDSKWNYSSDSRYHLYGVQLEVPLFEGFRNRNRIEEAELQLRWSELELQNTRSALTIKQKNAFLSYTTEWQNYQSALKQLKTAESYYSLINKGYREGINSFIETLDARNQLTSARMLVNISKYKVLIAKANYEREL